jgi:hypothetical protein
VKGQVGTLQWTELAYLRDCRKNGFLKWKINFNEAEQQLLPGKEARAD